VKLLKVRAWEKSFESAKSKGYNLKGQMYIPIKHGMGYHHLLGRPNGEALYGAWCALCACLSGKEKPRQGYLTDTTRPDGAPLTARDIAEMTGFQTRTIRSMIMACKSHKIGWLISDDDDKDTTGIPQGYHRGLSGDPPLPNQAKPLPSPPPSQTKPSPSPGVTPEDTETATAGKTDGVSDDGVGCSGQEAGPTQLHNDVAKRILASGSSSLTDMTTLLSACGVAPIRVSLDYARRFTAIQIKAVVRSVRKSGDVRNLGGLVRSKLNRLAGGDKRGGASERKA